MRTTPQQTHREGVPQFRSAIVGSATGSSRSKYPASPIRVLIRRVPREPRAVLDSSRLQRLSSKTSIFARRWHLCPHVTNTFDQLVWVDLPCSFRRLPNAGILARRIPYSPSLSARPSSIVDRASGKIDGRHGPLPAGGSTSRGHSGSRESKARFNTDAFGSPYRCHSAHIHCCIPTHGPSLCRIPTNARPSAAFPLAAKLPLLLQGGLMANLDASLPTREQLAMKSTAPNGFTVHARSRPRLRRLPCIHRLCVADRSQSRLATGGGRRLGRGEC